MTMRRRVSLRGPFANLNVPPERTLRVLQDKDNLGVFICSSTGSGRRCNISTRSHNANQSHATLLKNIVCYPITSGWTSREYNDVMNVGRTYYGDKRVPLHEYKPQISPVMGWTAQRAKNASKVQVRAQWPQWAPPASFVSNEHRRRAATDVVS